MSVPLPRPPVALSIAGSDPSGGAGIQADLKAFSALGAYGTCVITALTAQSTRGVDLVHAVPVEVVRAQLDTLVADVAIDVIKVGMLGSVDVAEAVLSALTEGPLREVPLVLDPVMAATSGSRLLAGDAVDALRELVRRADVVMPNVPEAAVLLDEGPATTLDDAIAQAHRLVAAGARRVLLTGGHLDGPEAVDIWLDPDVGDALPLRSPRIATRATHGTGCTLSSATAALRPRHTEWLPAVREAKDWLTGALRHGEDLAVGSGTGPLHHFHEQPRWGALSG